MAIRVVPHSIDHKADVETFNRTLREAGSAWGFYVDPEPTWLAKKAPDAPVHRSYWLALEDDSRVVGAFGLKPQSFQVYGKPVQITDWQGPVSLGAVDPRYGALGLRLMREMLKMHPYLFSWGHGGFDEPMLQMLIKMGWQTASSPVMLKLLRPRRVLGGFPSLLRDPEKARLARLLGLAPFAGLGIRVAETLLADARPWRAWAAGISYRYVAELGDTADIVWQAARSEYAVIAERSRKAMDLLMPRKDQAEWKNPIRLVVERKGRPIGWVALLVTDMKNDARFGDLRVATLVDYLARPSDAFAVIGAGVSYAREREADLVFANQTHRAWLHAMSAHGFFSVPNKRALAMSPALSQLVGSSLPDQIFFTNMDGHGPMGL